MERAVNLQLDVNQCVLSVEVCQKQDNVPIEGFCMLQSENFKLMLFVKCAFQQRFWH